MKKNNYISEMKNFRIQLILLVALIFALAFRVNRGNNKINNLNNQLDSVYYQLDSIKRELNEVKTNEFNKVFNRFKLYNKDIDTATVNQFISVVKHYKLDTTSMIYDACISQICLESGAKQFYKDGSIVLSSGNAVGISQITPTTAHHYLKYIVDQEDSIRIMELGATDFSFVHDKKRFTRKCRKEIIEWLKYPDNNLILWGYIMKHTLESQKYNITKALVEYNIGGGGLNQYISEGNSPVKHHYVVMVKDIINRFVRHGV